MLINLMQQSAKINLYTLLYSCHVPVFVCVCTCAVLAGDALLELNDRYTDSDNVLRTSSRSVS